MTRNWKYRKVLAATFMMFATAAVGMQPLLVPAGSGCECKATASIPAVTSESSVSCCGNRLAEPVQSDCCSSKPAKSGACCCNPEAMACQCGDCGCSENNESHSRLPAIPANEKTEIVSPVLICAAPVSGFARDIDLRSAEYLETVAMIAARSAQDTCVLLSRFTC